MPISQVLTCARSGLVLRRAPPEGDEDVLGALLGQLPVAEQSLGHAEDDRAVALVEHAEGIGVVRSDELDELGVVAFVGHEEMIAESGRGTVLTPSSGTHRTSLPISGPRAIDPAARRARTNRVPPSMTDGGFA